MAAEALMIDTCTIRRKTGATTDADGTVIDAYRTVYPDPDWPADHLDKSGRCKVQSSDTVESDAEAGGHTSTTQRAELHLPVARAKTDYQPQVGDLATINTSVLDPHLEDIELRVERLLHKTMATAYRLAVTDGV